MVRSMTGFGKATRSLDGEIISVELSAVNHRNLEPGVRLPSEWAILDSTLRDGLKQRIARGKISLTVSRKRGARSATALRFDRDVAQQYIAAAEEMGELLGTVEPLSVEALTRLDGIFVYEENGQDLEAAKAVVLETLDEALDRLDEMRVVEGRALGADIEERIQLLADMLGNIEERLPEINEAHEGRLRARIQELTEDTGLAEERLAIEIALLADKGDVTEEVVRLKSHFEHARELLRSQVPAGRQLNFLSQEIQREINTLSSKVRDTSVARHTLEMKSELEKIREQIQNIE